MTFPVSTYDIRIGNLGSTAASFPLDAGIPLGSEYNPDELTEGTHDLVMLEGSMGYYFETTAAEDGKLTVTVTGDSYWIFYLENEGDPDAWNDDVGYYFTEKAGDANTVTIDVAAGDYITLVVKLIDEEYAYIAGNLTVTVDFEHAGGEEETAVLGDVNGDGWVDVEDAMLILQYDAFVLGEDGLDLRVADVSGDDFVDVEDAMLILQYDAYLIDRFPAVNED